MERREKKQQRCGAEERAEAGDRWDHPAMAADSKRIVSLVVGKRTQEQTQTVVNDAKGRRRPGHVPAMCTEAYAGYESALLEAFGRRYPQPRHGATGRAARPMVRWPQGLASGPALLR